MILVTGATGTNGCEILARLARHGVPTTAMMRQPESAKGIPDAIGRVAGDFDDERSLDRALAGVKSAFLLTPSTEHAEAQQERFVVAAARAGVRHIVKLSQFAADADSPVRFLRYHAAVEAAIRRTDMTWTFLRPNLFMQGLLQFAGMIQRKDVFAAPIGSARVSAVDVRDIADVAVAALTGSGHEGRTYTLTGPEALTHGEMAVRLSAATGRTVAFHDASDDDLRQVLGTVGMPEWQIEGLIEDYAHYRRGEAAEIATGVLDVTRRKPRGFAEFARDYAESFEPPGEAAREEHRLTIGEPGRS